MLAFFRRFISSGGAVIILGVVILAFVVTGIGTGSGGILGIGGAGASSDDVATVGGKPVTVNDLKSRAQQELRLAAQQQPGITMPQLLAAIGGVPALVQQVVGQDVLTRWAERHGLVAGKRLVDGEIASIPAFSGPAGQFDEQQMRAVLSQQRMSYQDLRDGIVGDLLRRQLLVPLTAGARAPQGLLNPYAALLTDRREGVIGLVPAASGGPAPTDAEVAAYYQAHLPRYSLPDRRVVRYAPLGADTIGTAPPSDAEVAAYFKANAATYAASETRTVSQVVLPDAKAAQAFAAKVSGGTPFAKAAAEAGFAAGDISLGALTKDALAKSTSPAVADAVFALKEGGTTQPAKTELGFAIDHVDAIASHPARSLDQAKPEIVAALTKEKATKTIATLVQQIQDALNDGGSFADVAKRFKLQPVVTPPVLPDGTAPGDPAFKPDPTLVALMKVARDMGPEDQPSLETVAADRYALVGVQSVVRAAPIPLAEVKARVFADFSAERAATRARAQAQMLADQVKKGQPIAAAFAAAKLEAPKPIALTQVQASQAGANLPAPVRAVFRLTPGGTELVPGPAGGWYLVRLDRIVPGDPKLLGPIAAATREELGTSLGDEYAAQFAAAARAEVKVRNNPQAIAALERQLRGGGADAGGQ